MNTIINNTNSNEENAYIDLDVSIKTLYTHKWHIGSYNKYRNRYMECYILKQHKDLDIIDISQSKAILIKALNFLRTSVARGKKVLFIGTNHHASKAVAEHAERCGQYYISRKWFGGLLTNWSTFLSTINKMNQLDELINNNELINYTKKEKISLARKRDKFLSFMKGIRDMGSMPNIVIIASPQEKTAIKEVNLLRSLPLTSIMLVDTNNNPLPVNIAIPGNASSMSTVNHFCSLCADACLQGLLDEEERNMQQIALENQQQNEDHRSQDADLKSKQQSDDLKNQQQTQNDHQDISNAIS